ncbi:MAG: hypothetical protein WC662_04380, partial [Candidatus Paceibacterota bacterium]
MGEKIPIQKIFSNWSNTTDENLEKSGKHKLILKKDLLEKKKVTWQMLTSAVSAKLLVCLLKRNPGFTEKLYRQKEIANSARRITTLLQSSRPLEELKKEDMQALYE